MCYFYVITQNRNIYKQDNINNIGIEMDTKTINKEFNLTP
jgi:hypothetical protein